MNTKIVITFALMIALNVSSQDKLLLLNGRFDKGKIIAENE